MCREFFYFFGWDVALYPTLKQRAISKNGYTRSVWSQKRVQAGIKSKIPSTSHAIGQKQIVPVFQRLLPGYTCKWLLCSAFNRFWLFVTSSICFVLYLVVYGFGRYFLLFFGLYLLFKFFTTSFISLYSTIMRTCLRRSIYSYVQTMHVSLRLLYYLSG